jgi:hypothetical protein
MLDQWHSNQVVQEISAACIIIATELTRPSIMLRPGLRQSADKWIAKYHHVVGIGSTPEAAMQEFDRVWKEGK